MVRLVLVLFLSAFLFLHESSLAVESNQDFCAAGVDSLAFKLASAFKPGDPARLIVSSIEGRFGDVLRSRLAARLMERGFVVYLSLPVSGGSGKYQLQSTINEYSLKYVRSGGSAFRQGKLVREFTINASCRLLESDGKFVRTFDAPSFVLADTLSFEQARRARGSDLFMSPALPPTTFQRLVEPGIIAGVTGILVYLFFASR